LKNYKGRQRDQFDFLIIQLFNQSPDR